MAIQVNTGSVLATADQIDTINKKIREGLSEVDMAIRSLQQHWEGEASNSCANKYEYIKHGSSDARFSVVNSVVSFMRNQVGEGYEATEHSVSAAASAFK